MCGDCELTVVPGHRQRAADDDLARHAAGLLQDVVDARPVHRQKDRVRVTHGVRWCAGLSPFTGLPCEPLQLLFAVRIAEHDVVPGTSEECPQLSAHQTRTQNPDAHVSPLSSLVRRSRYA